MKKIRLSLVALSVLSLSFFACNSENKTAEEATTTTETEAPAEAPVAKTTTVEITGTDQMQYDKNEIIVHNGQEVTLILHHSGKQPKVSMGHNWVLLNQGVDMQSFDEKAAKAQATDYIPQDAQSDIIAHTKLLGGGESDTITFQAPPVGAYDFLCSFPGHSSMMKGKFLVVE